MYPFGAKHPRIVHCWQSNPDLLDEIAIFNVWLLTFLIFMVHFH